jgi:hypothetical protein
MARIYLTNDPESILRRRPDLNVYGEATMPVTIPAWPDPNTPEGGTFFANARKFVALYKAAGFGAPFAFGMAAMPEAEASFDVNALGDYVDLNGKKLPWSAHPHGTPTSFGAHQRKADRTNAICNGKIINGKIVTPGLGFDIANLAKTGMNTIENEVRATLWELNAYPSYGFAALQAAKTAYGVAYQATVSFERAGTVADGAAVKRAIMAETFVTLASGIWPRTRGPEPSGWEALTKGW